MKFEEVLPALRDGKKIRGKRTGELKHDDIFSLIFRWQTESAYGQSATGHYTFLGMLDDDWEIVEETSLPCPFCGEGKVMYTASTTGRVAMVQCSNKNCHALGPQADSMENAIKLWNKAKR